MSRFVRLCDLALAFSIGLGLAVLGAPAHAIEAPAGSKNFTPPGDVPNYFSNESGPFRGGAAASTAQQGAVPVAAAPVAVAPVAHSGRAMAAHRTSRHHHPGRVAKASGHTRLAHGKAGGHRQVAHAGTARHGHAPEPKVAHAPGPKAAHVTAGHLAGKTVAAKSRAASSKGKHPARAHG